MLTEITACIAKGWKVGRSVPPKSSAEGKEISGKQRAKRRRTDAGPSTEAGPSSSGVTTAAAGPSTATGARVAFESARNEGSSTSARLASTPATSAAAGSHTTRPQGPGDGNHVNVSVPEQLLHELRSLNATMRELKDAMTKQ